MPKPTYEELKKSFLGDFLKKGPFVHVGGKRDDAIKKDSLA